MRPPLADASLLEINTTFVVEIIAFVVMLAVLARWVYPRIIAAAEERQNKIEAGVRAAEEAERRLASVQEQVEQTLNEAREQAREIIARAHRDAVVEAEDVRVRARGEAEALLQRAAAEIGAERDRAINELRNEVSTLVVTVAGRVIGEALDPKAHQRLIDDALAKVTADEDAPAGRA